MRYNTKTSQTVSIHPVLQYLNLTFLTNYLMTYENIQWIYLQHCSYNIFFFFFSPSGSARSNFTYYHKNMLSKWVKPCKYICKWYMYMYVLHACVLTFSTGSRCLRGITRFGQLFIDLKRIIQDWYVSCIKLLNLHVHSSTILSILFWELCFIWFKGIFIAQDLSRLCV